MHAMKPLPCSQLLRGSIFCKANLAVAGCNDLSVLATTTSRLNCYLPWCLFTLQWQLGNYRYCNDDFFAWDVKFFLVHQGEGYIMSLKMIKTPEGPGQNVK